MFTVNIYIKKVKYVFICVEIVTYSTSGGALHYDQHYDWLIVAELASIRYEVVCCLAEMLLPLQPPPPHSGGKSREFLPSPV